MRFDSVSALAIVSVVVVVASTLVVVVAVAAAVLILDDVTVFVVVNPAPVDVRITGTKQLRAAYIEERKYVGSNQRRRTPQELIRFRTNLCDMLVNIIPLSGTSSSCPLPEYRAPCNAHLLCLLLVRTLSVGGHLSHSFQAIPADATFCVTPTRFGAASKRDI